ncbi:MAG: NADAR family protein [Rhodobacteraceae bacterium]|nr:NADAR family protein [Paracoccaceae bacterium]
MSAVPPERFVFFWNGPFSQWTASPFELDGQGYLCAEQYMMSQKAALFGDEQIAEKIAEAQDPGLQKALGRRVRGFNQAVWDREKVAIVERGSAAKFQQNRGFRRKLFQTIGATLVEASPVDPVWGIGLAADDPSARDRNQWLGANLLGEILTRVRDRLADEMAAEANAVERDYAAQIDAARCDGCGDEHDC